MSTIIILLIVALHCFSMNNATNLSMLTCLYTRNDNVDGGGPHCCNTTYSTFRFYYEFYDLKLTSYLEKLKTWNCPQFKDECENRYFNFNRFTFLVYEKFCNESNFMRICEKEVKILKDLQDFENSTSQTTSMI